MQVEKQITGNTHRLYGIINPREGRCQGKNWGNVLHVLNYHNHAQTRDISGIFPLFRVRILNERNTLFFLYQEVIAITRSNFAIALSYRGVHGKGVHRLRFKI